MTLKGNNGNEFELGFVRDSLPDTQDGFGDTAWATVSFRAATNDDTWEDTAPCMNLFEFANLADWLQAVGEGDAPEISEVELLEPELKFSLSQETQKAVTIRIGFHLAGRPEEFGVDSLTDEADYIDIHLARATVASAANALRAELADFAREMKDDTRGESDTGVLGAPDDGLNIEDDVKPYPPGAGTGEDNAGNS